MSATITGLTGATFTQGTQAWENNKYQYAWSSHGIEHNMNPGLIVSAASKSDIIATLAYARSKKLAVAIRTGGHQYSGASSTAAPNILLDVSRTFRKPEDLRLLSELVEKPRKGEEGSWKEGEKRRLVYVSVSHALDEFNLWMGKQGVFVPHGQCAHVHLGGHVQTGGYGQLGRSFGLFGDHVRSLEIIDFEGKERTVTRESDPDLFWAILGGSPGNFGVLTHFTLEVYRDEDYKGALGMKALFLYDEKQVKRMMGMIARMADEGDWPRNYDLCASVLSSSFPLGSLAWPGLDTKMKQEMPSIFGEDKIVGWPKTMVVYAQWVPVVKGEQPDQRVMDWFKEIGKGCLKLFSDGIIRDKSMSALTRQWLFLDVREFDLPYEKRTYLTNSTTLQKDNWPEWVAGRINKVVEPWDNKQWLSCQIQYFGGKNSMFVRNRNNGTSYSWREDSTVCATLDNFHWSIERDAALAWQKENDQVGVGKAGIFSKQDRRVLWGSYGSFDFDSVHRTYHETEEKYKKLGQIRTRMDPDGTFTPNTFCVKKA